MAQEERAESVARDWLTGWRYKKIKGNERAERRLALLIMRHVNRGENDPERLAVSATLDFLR